MQAPSDFESSKSMAIKGTKRFTMLMTTCNGFMVFLAVGEDENVAGACVVALWL